VLGNLDQYTKFQTANAIQDAAKNPGGVAGLGAGLGAGVAVGQQMGAALGSAFGAGATAASAPPPMPTAVAFHAAIDGASAGPFDMSALAAQVKAGKITRKSLVWRSGMANWVAADSLPELQGFFGDVPPPLPG
jgi:hypothetical protein